MSKKLQKELEKFIESLGAKREEEVGYTHVFPSRIGSLHLRVDTEGQTVALFGNFLGNEEEAKKVFGHWKYNLHLMKTDPNIERAFKYHLEKTK